MLNLGGLFFTLDADTRGLINSQRRVESFANTVKQAFRGVNAGTVDWGVANAFARQERAVISMMERVKTLQGHIKASSVAPVEQARLLEKMGKDYDNFTRKMAGGKLVDNLDFGRRMAHMRSQITDTQREFKRLEAVANQTKSGFVNFSGVLHGLGSASLFINGHLGGMSTRFFALTSMVREFGVVAAVSAATVAGLSAGISLLAVSAVQAGRELQGIQAGFKALTGNAVVAATHIDYVRSVANQAGTAFNDTAKGYMRFLASAQTGGLTLQQTQDAFKGVTLAAATMQLSTEDMQGVFRALDQMMSKGTVQAEELRGQLGDRLPGAFQIAAVAMGVTTAELGKMMKKGEVMSSEFVPKFVEALQRMWNIDPTANINTLTASIARLSNEWTYFGQALDRATGATRVFQVFIDGLVSGLQGLSAHLPQIISWLGALTGAFVGLGVAMAINSLITYVSAWGSISAALLHAAGVVRTLFTGIIALNVAMAANPVLRLITVFITLTGVLWGAKAGYDALNTAVALNEAALSNLSAIEGYIAAQKRMGFQVQSTTQAMMQQVAAQNAIDSRAAMEANIAVADRRGNPTFIDHAQSLLSTMSYTKGGDRSKIKTPQQIAIERSGDLAAEAEKAVNKARRTAVLYGELQDLLKLPAPPTATFSAAEGGGGKGKGSKGARQVADTIDTVEDYVLRMQRADERMRELSRGTLEYKLVDDLFRAKEALNQLNPAQLSKVDGALKNAGFTAGDLESRLASVFTRTRQAEEAARVFNQVWDDLGSGAVNLERITKQLGYIRSGGDPKNLVNFEAFARASDMLRDIDVASAAGRDALLGIQNRLSALGMQTLDTGNILEDTKNSLASFFQKEAQGQKLVGVLSDLHNETRQLRDRMSELDALKGGVGGSSLAGLFGNPEESERAISNAVKRGQAVRELIRDMTLAGAAQGEINKKATEYLDLLRNIDAGEDAYTRMKANAEQTKETFRGMVHAGVSGFRDLISGAKSFGDALLDLMNNVLDIMWQRFVTQPINDLFDNIGRKKDAKTVSGLDASIAGLTTAANDNQSGAKEIGALGTAAATAADAVRGNFLSAITQGAIQLLTSMGVETAKTAMVTASTGAEANALVAKIAGTAALNTLTSSAISAAVALGSISGSGEEGGSGSGLLGSLLAIGKAAIPGKAGGGLIRGPGTGTSDSIMALVNGVKPLLVSNGESIVTAKATRQFWPLIDAMNKGRLPGLLRRRLGFAEGGQVSDSDYLFSTLGSIATGAPSNNNGSFYLDTSGDIIIQGSVGPDELESLKAELRARERRIIASLPGHVDGRMLENKVRRPMFGAK